MKKRTQKTLMMVLFLCALSLPNLASAQSLLLAALACANDNIHLDLDAFANLPESIRNATTSENDYVFFEMAVHNGYASDNHDDVVITTKTAEEEIADKDKTYRYDSAVGVFWGCADRQVKKWMEDDLDGEYVAWNPAWDVGNERSYNHYFAFMAPDNGVINEDENPHFVRSEAAVTAGYNAGFQYGYQCDALLEVTIDNSCNNLFANGLSIEACDKYATQDTGISGDTGAGDTGSGGTGGSDTAATASKAAPKSFKGVTLKPCSSKNTDGACSVKSSTGATQVYVR